jgi:hypothetical protein
MNNICIGEIDLKQDREESYKILDFMKIVSKFQNK